MTRLIDADRLKEVFSRNVANGDAFNQLIDIQPTVDAVPVRHGEWIGYPECLRYEKALTDDDYACSCCGEVFSCIDNDMERFDYCPHCGAKMDGEIEEE